MVAKFACVVLRVRVQFCGVAVVAALDAGVRSCG